MLARLHTALGMSRKDVGIGEESIRTTTRKHKISHAIDIDRERSALASALYLRFLVPACCYSEVRE